MTNGRTPSAGFDKKSVIVEPKIDGQRVFAISGGRLNRKVLLITKHNGSYREEDFPNLFAELQAIMFPLTILDGEFLRKEGRLFVDIQIPPEACEKYDSRNQEVVHQDRGLAGDRETRREEGKG